MHLAADYIHPTPRGGGRCRVCIYLLEDDRDAVVVICTELSNNPRYVHRQRRHSSAVISTKNATEPQSATHG